MKLIIEEMPNTVEYITEGVDGSKKHYIQGIFLQSNIQNKNGRIYPPHIMENEVNRYTHEVIKNNRGYGELGHTDGPQINLDRVSHMIKELVKDGDNYIGKALIAETPSGNIVKGLLASGANLGSSSRALGSLKSLNNGIMEVQSDFKLATASDIVANPSGPDCFVNGIMENVNWVYDEKLGSYIMEQLTDTKKHIHTLSKSQLEEQKLSIFEEFMKKILSK